MSIISTAGQPRCGLWRFCVSATVLPRLDILPMVRNQWATPSVQSVGATDCGSVRPQGRLPRSRSDTRYARVKSVLRCPGLEVVFVEATWELEGRSCAPTSLDRVGPTVLSQCAMRVSCISPFDRRGRSVCLLTSSSKVALPQRRFAARVEVMSFSWDGQCVANLVARRLLMAPMLGGAPGCRSQSRRSRPHSGLPMKLGSMSVHATFLLVRVTVHEV